MKPTPASIMTSQQRAMAEDHRKQTEDNARKLGSLESDVTGLKGDVQSIRNDMRSSFDAVFAKLDRAMQPRGTQWGAVAVLITVLMALAAWANSWVSANISSVGGSASEALRRADTAGQELRDHKNRQAEREIDYAERRGREDERLRQIEARLGGFDKAKAAP